jgi:uncharacterized protein YceH (UPF0502 family)
MPLLRNAAEARVLGSLLEKDITTPDYYPLSLNALINACNQKQNRDPVMQLEEETVRLALRGLEDAGMVTRSRGTDSRVPKYEHRLQEVFNFTRGESAILCVLLLRGPQTPGELRGRTERMFEFRELDDVLSTLQKLMQRDPPLARVLPKQPGTKEARYMHLMLGESLVESATSTAPTEASPLEDEVAALRRELEELKSQFAALKLRVGE